MTNKNMTTFTFLKDKDFPDASLYSKGDVLVVLENFYLGDDHDDRDIEQATSWVFSPVRLLDGNEWVYTYTAGESSIDVRLAAWISNNNPINAETTAWAIIHKPTSWQTHTDTDNTSDEVVKQLLSWNLHTSADGYLRGSVGLNWDRPTSPEVFELDKPALIGYLQTMVEIAPELLECMREVVEYHENLVR
jgi:hypothetical protein